MQQKKECAAQKQNVLRTNEVFGQQEPKVCGVVERAWTEEGKELCTNRRVDMTELAESCESLSARSPLALPPSLTM